MTWGETKRKYASVPDSFTLWEHRLAHGDAIERDTRFMVVLKDRAILEVTRKLERDGRDPSGNSWEYSWFYYCGDKNIPVDQIIAYKV